MLLSRYFSFLNTYILKHYNSILAYLAMHVTSELPSKTLQVLKPANNKVRVSENTNKKTRKKTNTKMVGLVSCNNSSMDSMCSSEGSSSSGEAVKKGENNMKSFSRRKNEKVVKEIDNLDTSQEVVPFPIKRCEWITPSYDPLYTSFHDKEWGVPVRDDTKLFELLTLSVSLSEFTWPTILTKRHVFRKVFENFNPSCIAKYTEKEMAAFVSNGGMLLSEPKLRAVVENAKQVLKIQQEFGSFSNYLWSFVNDKPIRNRFRYGRQLPVKTPKAELISKDLMNLGFRCVGPSVVYSFMQVAGLVNDHLITCFRYQECNGYTIEDVKPKKDEKKDTTNY